MNGIFALRNKVALRGLGDVDVPYWCWNQDSFKTCSDKTLADAQSNAEGNGLSAGTEAYDSFVAGRHDEYMNSICLPACLAAQPTDPASTPATTTGGGSVVCPSGTWNAPDNMSCVKSSGKCTDAAVISYVQSQIGATVDGKWGPNSTAALAKTGKKFSDFAPGCDGAAPGGGSGTGGGISKITPKAGGVKAAPAQAGAFLGVPLIAWAGVAAVAAVLLYTSKKKQAVANRRRRARRHHR